MNTLIVCLGNERVSDDGVGAVVGHALRLLPLPANVEVRTVSKISFDLLDRVAASDQLVLVDALGSAGEPGTCTVVDVTDLPPALGSSECAHCATALQLLDFVRYVACEDGARRVAIAGIEGRQFLRYGASLSEDIWAAVPRMVDLILLFVGATVQARGLVREVCERLRWTDGGASLIAAGAQADSATAPAP